eukprot:TRINITY_DN13019_c0_g1_i2.p1 TRINITY_DN13019_c0_g1~~TRINITY_DN13019_c0_g1_i2.p1  ORF type:complete len:476 (+),score=122.34 TRINITY_DN13019_c0_g1_i2:67-1494(+)
MLAAERECGLLDLLRCLDQCGAESLGQLGALEVLWQTAEEDPELRRAADEAAPAAPAHQPPPAHNMSDGITLSPVLAASDAGGSAAASLDFAIGSPAAASPSAAAAASGAPGPSPRSGARSPKPTGDSEARQQRVEARRQRDFLFDLCASEHQRSMESQMRQAVGQLPHDKANDDASTRFRKGLAPLLLAADRREDRSVWRGLWYLRRACRVQRKRPEQTRPDGSRTSPQDQRSPSPTRPPRRRHASPVQQGGRATGWSPLLNDPRNINFVRLLVTASANRRPPPPPGQLPHLRLLAACFAERRKRRAAAAARRQWLQQQEAASASRDSRVHTISRGPLHPVWKWEQEKGKPLQLVAPEEQRPARQPVDTGPLGPLPPRKVPLQAVRRSRRGQPSGGGAAAVLARRSTQRAASSGPADGGALELSSDERNLLRLLCAERDAALSCAVQSKVQQQLALGDSAALREYDRWLRAVSA